MRYFCAWSQKKCIKLKHCERQTYNNATIDDFVFKVGEALDFGSSRPIVRNRESSNWNFNSYFIIAILFLCCLNTYMLVQDKIQRWYVLQGLLQDSLSQDIESLRAEVKALQRGISTSQNQVPHIFFISLDSFPWMFLIM